MTQKKHPKFIDRVLDLAKRDPELLQHIPDDTFWEDCGDASVPLANKVDRLLEIYGDRPALGEREYTLEDADGAGHFTRRYGPGFRSISYSGFRNRIRSIASAWKNQERFEVKQGELVCIMGFAGVDFAAIDTACLYTQTVSVPIQASYGFETLKRMLDLVEPRLLATATANLEMAARLAESIGSVSSLIVFDYDEGDSKDRAAWQAAKEALTDSCPRVAAISLNDLIEHENPDGWEMMPPHGDGPERFSTILHSSGSTGMPKGAMLPERAIEGMWREFPKNAPAVTIGLAPLNHMLGRSILSGTLGVGGRLNFTLAEDMSTLMEDIRVTRPTTISLVPRIVDMIYKDYLNQVTRRMDEIGVSENRAREEIKNEFRDVYLGDRLLAGVVASAPTTREVRDFMKSCFNIPIADGYSATEAGAGTISSNNRITRPNVLSYKLRDTPELGYYTSDKPYPRGELGVKTANQILGYYKNPEASENLMDAEGFYMTGDIVEERGLDHVVIIDRRNDILKLSQGEYVAIGRLETLFVSESDFIEQIYVYGNSLNSYLVAVVVPDMAALTAILGNELDDLSVQALIRDEFQRIGEGAGLKSFEVPREFILEHEPFSTQNGLLTSVLKKKRPALKAKYCEQLEKLYDKGEKLRAEQLKGLADSESTLSAVEKVRILLAINLGIEEKDVDNTMPYQSHGGDSLGSVALSVEFEQIFGLELSASEILSPNGCVDTWARILDERQDVRISSFEEVHGNRQDHIFAEDLTLDRFLPADLLTTARSLPTSKPRARQTVFLTGANGFLGRIVCLEWLKRVSQSGGKLICLVRASDDDAARKRLSDAFESAGSEVFATFNRFQNRLEVLAGDFGQINLGLTPQKFEALAEDVDLITHVGALVNHVMDYKSLFTPNVGGVAEIVRLALSNRKKSIDFVSTAAATSYLQFNTGGAENARLADSVKLNSRYANGYGASKWAGEILLREAQACFGIPVRIYRGDMMLAHTEIGGQINSEDMFTRLLFSVIKTGVAPRSFYEPNPDGSRALVPYDGIPVDVVAKAVVDGGLFFDEGFTVFCMENPFSSFANSLDAFVDWIIEAGYELQRLEAYGDWLSRFQKRMMAMPEADKKRSFLPLLKAFKSPLSYVPFKRESTNFQSLLEKSGTPASQLQLDASYIYKCLQDMASKGLVESPRCVPVSAEPRAKSPGPANRVTRAYGVKAASAPISAMDIERRALGPDDVSIDIEFCGICHSDIHFAHNDWGVTQYPLVPGHEIVGRVTAVGETVSVFSVGDRVAVGNMVDSCRNCASCDDGLEQYCDGGLVYTYNSYDHRHGNALTAGGYSEHIVVNKDFVIAVPEHLDPAAVAPLLCAGITTWSPLRQWDIKEGMRVGVIGLGGLGHMGIKFASALGAHTVMISTSPEKADDAIKLGASEVLISKDYDAMRAQRNGFDFILDTVPVQHDIDDYVRLLKRDATLCLLGALEPLAFNAGRVSSRRKCIVGSSIGSIAETRDMMAFCGEHNITADIELIKPSDIQNAWDRVQKNDIKYRFVLDMR
jgi:fatty acid CoA ligase FadD9